MSNSIIPYSFIPGSKAKAEEVNANFNAVVEEINTNKTYFNNRVNDVETKTDNLITVDFEELKTSVGDNIASKIDNTYLPAGIIEAPAGVAELNGSVITVMNGLTLLIPDGRDANGKLKNVKYTFEKDVEFSRSDTSATGTFLLFTDKAGTLFCTDSHNFYQHFAAPKIDLSKTEYWYDTKSNYLYSHSAESTTWTKCTNQAYPIAEFQQSGVAVSDLTPYTVTKFVTVNNGYDDIVTDSWHSDDYTSWYRKYKSGWVEQGGFISSLGYDGTSTQNFPIPFKTLQYSISGATNYIQYSGDKRSTWRIYDYTKTSLTIQARFEQGGGSIWWQAKGY